MPSGGARRRAPEEVPLAPDEDVAEPARAAALAVGEFGAPALELVNDERVGGSREPLDARVDPRAEVHALQRHRHADVEALREPVVGEEDGGVGLEVDGEVRLDDVALEPEIEVARVPVRVLVGQVEVEIASPQVLPLEAVPRAVLVVDREAELALPRGERPLGEDRAERLRRAVVDAQRLVEGVREPSRRGAHGERGELGGDPGVELGQDGLRVLLGAEVRVVAQGRVRVGGEDDRVLLREEPQEQPAQPSGALGQGGASHPRGDDREHHGQDAETPHGHTS